MRVKRTHTDSVSEFYSFIDIATMDRGRGAPDDVQFRGFYRLTYSAGFWHTDGHGRRKRVHLEFTVFEIGLSQYFQVDVHLYNCIAGPDTGRSEMKLLITDIQSGVTRMTYITV